MRALGTWRRDGAAPPTHRVVVAGDWYPRRTLESLAIGGPQRLYGGLLPVLRDADLRIVNLEAPLSRRGAPIAKDGPSFRAPPACVAGLSAVPFEVACLANNHILDFGAEALEDTLAILGDNEILSVGAGLTPDHAREPVVAEVRGLRLGIVNFCEGEDGTAATEGPGTFGWEPDRVVRAVAALRRRADAVLVIAHAGREYVPVPPPYIQRLYRSLAESGADVIVGHHPHVPQGVEIHGDVPIAYSLGNFVFRQRRGGFRHHGLLLGVGFAEGRVCELVLHPFAIEETGLRRLRAPARDWLLAQLGIASEVLADPDRVREVWHAFIDRFGAEWWVFDADGTALGRALPPPGMGVFEIGADYVLGLRRDELDVESVELHELTRAR